MNTEQVNEIITSLEGAGELTIREEKFLKLAKAYADKEAESVALALTFEKCREVSGCPAGVDLQDHLRQLAAENVGLIRSAECLLHEASEVYRAYNKTQLPDGDLVDGQSLQEVWDAINATPATDAYLAGIKADGAKAAGDYLKLEAQHMPVVERLMMQDAAEICNGTAARLREGADK